MAIPFKSNADFGDVQAASISGGPQLKVRRTTGSAPSSLPYGSLGIANNTLYFGNSSGRPVAVGTLTPSNDSTSHDICIGIAQNSSGAYVPAHYCYIVRWINSEVDLFTILWSTEQKTSFSTIELNATYQKSPPTLAPNVLPEFFAWGRYYESGVVYTIEKVTNIFIDPVYNTTTVTMQVFNHSKGTSLSKTTVLNSSSSTLYPLILPCRVTCLHEDTLITLFDGTRKPIKSIVPGDLLLSYDFTTNTHVPAVCMWNASTKQDFHSNYYLFSNGHVLKQDIEGSHEVYNVTKGCWTTCGTELEIGDVVLDEEGNECKYLGVDPYVHTLHETNFYDIVVSNNCYYANGILMAHNPCLKMKHLEHIVSPKIQELILQDVLAEKLYFDFTDITSAEEIITPWSKEQAIIKNMDMLKKKLADTDYVVLKKLEGLSVDPEILTARAAWRKEYNELQTLKDDCHAEYCIARAKYNPLGQDALLSEFDYKGLWLRQSNKRGNDNFELYKSEFCIK